MCKVFNTIGSLTAIKSHLRHYNITDFSSVKSLIFFQNNYQYLRQQILFRQEGFILEEKNALRVEISQLTHSIEERRTVVEENLRLEVEHFKDEMEKLHFQENLFRKFVSYFKKRSLQKRIRTIENSTSFYISQSVQDIIETLAAKKNRLDFITSRFCDAVEERCLMQLSELKRKKKIVDEINSSIYGALGEQKVLKEIEKLSDEYFLINDFAISFPTPIYNQQENDYIRSIQIDHLLISRSGIFLIETKNWSASSQQNWQLRSPIAQIRRANFALFKIVVNGIKCINVSLNQHHWGDRKIPIRNLIVLTNTKPSEEFQYVKVLTLNELLSYVKYFKPIFSAKETEEIANYLVRINLEKEYLIRK